MNPFLSSTDIRSGSRWYEEIAKELGQSRFGIVCLTPDNLEAAWILFEAGALAKTSAEIQKELTERGKAASKNYLCPYLIGGLKESDIKPPLSQYHWRESTETSTLELFQDINSIIKEIEGPEEALSDEDLKSTFAPFWPALKAAIDTAPSMMKPKQRTPEEYLEEILGLVRGLAQSVAAFANQSGLSWDLPDKLILSETSMPASLEQTFRALVRLPRIEVEEVVEYFKRRREQAATEPKPNAASSAEAKAEKPARKTREPVAKKAK